MRIAMICVAMLAIGSASQARADYDEVSPIDGYDPSTDPAVQEYAHQTERFEQALYHAQTDPEFAGYDTRMEFRGKLYIVDRRSEPKIKVNGRNPPSLKPSVLDLIGDLSVKAKGQFRVKVIFETYDVTTGNLVSRDIWSIDAGAMWQADTSGMDDAMSKQHK